MGTDWTIDTYVLYRAGEVDYDAIAFLWRVARRTHKVAFDHERESDTEYRTCLRETRRQRSGGAEALHKWFKLVVDKLAVRYSGKLESRHRRKLAAMGFDRSDWPFVAVSSRTVTKNLVTEDSDYNDLVKDYLHAEMSVSVLSIRESLEVHSD